MKLTRAQMRHFRNLWESNEDIYEFYNLAREIKEISFRDFDKGWQYRVVLHPQFKVAVTEFKNILIGCY